MEIEPGGESSVRRKLRERLRRGDFAAVVMHRETHIPPEVVGAVVEDSLPVHLADSAEKSEEQQ